MQVPQQKGGKIVWTCVDDNIIGHKEENRESRIHGFDYSLFEEKEDEGVIEGI